MNVLNTIREQYSSMSATERKIADVILSDPEKVTSMTIAYLATKAQVSEGSIINFSNNVGAQGFTNLKINIAQNLQNFLGFSFEDVNDSDSPKTAMQKMISNANDAFESTYRNIRNEDLEAAAKMLINAKRIEIYGVAGSAFVAQDAYYHFMRIGLPAYAVTDSMLCAISASHLGPDCVAVGISDSGRTRETLRAMEIAKERGAATLCITSYESSPIVKLSQIALVIDSNESRFHRESVVSRLTQMLILDSLCAYIGAQKGVESIRLMDEALRLIGEHQESNTVK